MISEHPLLTPGLPPIDASDNLKKFENKRLTKIELPPPWIPLEQTIEFPDSLGRKETLFLRLPQTTDPCRQPWFLGPAHRHSSVAVQGVKPLQLRKHSLKEIFARVPNKPQRVKPGNPFRGYLAFFVVPGLVPAPRRQVRAAFDFANASVAVDFSKSLQFAKMTFPFVGLGIPRKSHFIQPMNLLGRQFSPPPLEALESCPLSEEPMAVFVRDALVPGFAHVILPFREATFPWAVTSLPFLDYSITVNLYPQNVRREISRAEKSLERVRGDYAAEGKHSLLTSKAVKEERIKHLAQGDTVPFLHDYVVHVWDSTEDGLISKTRQIETAFGQMEDAQCWTSNVSSAATTKNMWFQTWPGWVWGKYIHHADAGLDEWLADMRPPRTNGKASLQSRPQRKFPALSSHRIPSVTFGTPRSPSLLPRIPAVRPGAAKAA